MFTPQLCIMALTALATAVAAEPHNGLWSRHHHQAIARAAHANAGELLERSENTKRSARSIGRRMCKTPSSTSSGAVNIVATSAVAQAPSSTVDQTTARPSSSAPATAAPPKSKSPKPSATTTSTTSNAASTGSSSSGSGSGSGSGSSSGGAGALALSSLFPLGQGSDSWSTSPKASSPLPLSDATFQANSVLKALTHTYMAAPDGKQAMQAIYPQGSYVFTSGHEGGFSFYAPGPNSLDMTTAKTLTFGYSVYFPADFDFNIGGKLPGIYGGNTDSGSKSCSGGRRSNDCFSARLMFRKDGAGELYTYLPPGFTANNRVCSIGPKSECNPTYGASVGRGSFFFKAGEWTTISERIQLNDVGQENGRLTLWANGQQVIDVDGLVLRNSAAGVMRGIQMQTFFGGSSVSFASPKTQDSYFSDFSAAIIEKL